MVITNFFWFRGLKGGWPLLRSVPSHSTSKGETQRLITMATKLLVATVSIQPGWQPCFFLQTLINCPCNYYNLATGNIGRTSVLRAEGWEFVSHLISICSMLDILKTSYLGFFKPSSKRMNPDGGSTRNYFEYFRKPLIIFSLVLHPQSASPLPSHLKWVQSFLFLHNIVRPVFRTFVFFQHRKFHFFLHDGI